jgi:DNA-directed RNA polymerase subunit omega
MAERRNTMMEPPLEVLLDKVDSKFALVTLAAKRGREINTYFNQLGEGIGTIAPPQVTSVSRKPLSIALEEVAASKVVIKDPSRAGEEAEEGTEGPALEALPAEAEDAGPEPPAAG